MYSGMSSEGMQLEALHNFNILGKSYTLYLYWISMNGEHGFPRGSVVICCSDFVTEVLLDPGKEAQSALADTGKCMEHYEEYYRKLKIGSIV